MRCVDVMGLLESIAPVSYAEEWDNVGLLLGRKDKTVHKVMLAVDATDDVVQQAVLQGVDMLITHHPLLFSAVKRITEDDFIGRRLIHLIKNDICYYAMHTNFDVMGMADAAADMLQLHSPEVLEVIFEDEVAKEGIGRIGRLPHEMSLKECAQYCKTVFGLDSVRIYGDEDAPVETVAIVPGAGDDYIKNALSMQADVFITGDIGHHDGLDAMEQGLAVIDASHYGIEKLFVPYMAEVLEGRMPELVVIKATEKEPFTVV